MAFHHRKLLNESSIITTKVTDFCQPYCDDDHGDQNHNGTCPLPCISLCHPTCNTPFLEIPPPVAELPEPPIDFPYVTPDKGAHNKLSLLLTVSLAVLAAAFFLLTCYTVYKLCSSCYNSRRRRRRRRRLLETRGEANGDGGGGDDDDFFDHEGHVVDHPIWYIRTVGLQPSVISAISIVKYKKVDGLIEGTDCSVCLSEFQEGEALRLLPKCNHAFHIPCIDTWLRSHTNCPLCRAGIVKSVGQQELVAQGSGRVVVEARVGASGRSGGVISRRESQDGDEFSEVRIGVEEDSESWPRIGIKINDDLGEVEGGGDSSSDGRGLEGVQPMRRSVSVDSLSASVISAAVKGGQSDGRNSEDQMAGEKVSMRVGSNLSLSGLVGSSSSSNQTGPSYVRRSLSCTAKVFLSRYSNGGSSTSRSRNSVVPQ